MTNNASNIIMGKQTNNNVINISKYKCSGTNTLEDLMKLPTYVQNYIECGVMNAF